MATITTLGEQAIAQALGNGSALVIDEFMLAFVPGLDPSVNPPKTELVPAAQYIVHSQAPEKSGYIDDNRVAYSVMLQPELGDFQFNWVGLLSAGMLVAVAYVYTASKIKTVGTKLGNVLARNMVIKFDGVKAILPIAAPAQSWMFDFSKDIQDIKAKTFNKFSLNPVNPVCVGVAQHEVVVFDDGQSATVTIDAATMAPGDKVEVQKLNKLGRIDIIGTVNIDVPNGVSELNHWLPESKTGTLIFECAGINKLKYAGGY
jgi:hypothetical protein